MSVPLLRILQRLVDENLHGPTSLKREEIDMDTRDPRWFELFLEYYTSPEHEVQDDLLFFVRQHVPSFKSSSGSINELDPVFVKRRVPGAVPNLADIVDWKQSFYLNLISQIPCTLTVAVCTRQQSRKAKMVAIQRTTKKVFAAPYKSRMDVKDAFMNECSFPLVYYTVNDYDSSDLFLPISDNQYLCVELSITIPKNPTSQAYRNATTKVAEITIEEDSSPFPITDEYSKVILFQGAVSFSSLVDVYQQKGLAAQNQLRSGWGRLLSSENSEEAILKRKEYIMMRGPQGKGQCQVAITENRETPPKEPSSSSLFKSIKNSLFSDNDIENTRPEKLICSLTYVNIPWQAIVNDLLEFIKTKNSETMT